MVTVPDWEELEFVFACFLESEEEEPDCWDCDWLDEPEAEELDRIRGMKTAASATITARTTTMTTVETTMRR